MDLQLCLIIPCVVLGLCVVYAQGQGKGIQADPCLPNPCVKGTCAAKAAGNGFRCTCDALQIGNWKGAWKGTKCTISRCPRRRPTNPVCKNGGKCVNNGPEIPWSCACQAGFGGPTCETTLVHCLSSPCNTGTCQEDALGYTCSCPTGFTGTNCETAVVAQSGNAAKSAGSIDGINGVSGLNQNHGSHGQEMNSLTMLVATFITLCAARFLL